ncbi:hypothetical protein EDB84DRAFT_1556522 [Lactarius hengduanensis]|nr:hypothetical protein EDB84DRAFT_1556522 [Lactarius hengduanensis]
MAVTPFNPIDMAAHHHLNSATPPPLSPQSATNAPSSTPLHWRCLDSATTATSPSCYRAALGPQIRPLAGSLPRAERLHRGLNTTTPTPDPDPATSTSPRHPSTLSTRSAPPPRSATTPPTPPASTPPHLRRLASAATAIF